MAECTSGSNLTVLVLNRNEADALEQFFIDYHSHINHDTDLEAIAIAIGAW